MCVLRISCHAHFLFAFLVLLHQYFYMYCCCNMLCAFYVHFPFNSTLPSSFHHVCLHRVLWFPWVAANICWLKLLSIEYTKNSWTHFNACVRACVRARVLSQSSTRSSPKQCVFVSIILVDSAQTKLNEWFSLWSFDPFASYKYVYGVCVRVVYVCASTPKYLLFCVHRQFLMFMQWIVYKNS